MTAEDLMSLGPELAGYLDEFRDCFGRSEPRGKLATYVWGQLGELPRKSALADGLGGEDEAADVAGVSGEC